MGVGDAVDGVGAFVVKTASTGKHDGSFPPSPGTQIIPPQHGRLPKQLSPWFGWHVSCVGEGVVGVGVVGEKDGTGVGEEVGDDDVGCADGI